MTLNNKKIQMFRTHIDPMIGPKASLAFSIHDPLNKAIGLNLELTTIGVFASWRDRKNNDQVHEHLVPFANIQSIKFEVFEVGESLPITEESPKKKLGRPFKDKSEVI